MTRGALGPTSQAADHGEFNAGTLDQALRDLSAKTSWWASQDPGSRAALLEATLDATVAASGENIPPTAQERVELRIHIIERPAEGRRPGNPVGNHFVLQGPHIGLATANVCHG